MSNSTAGKRLPVLRNSAERRACTRNDSQKYPSPCPSSGPGIYSKISDRVGPTERHRSTIDGRSRTVKSRTKLPDRLVSQQDKTISMSPSIGEAVDRGRRMVWSWAVSKLRGVCEMKPISMLYKTDLQMYQCDQLKTANAL